MENPPRQVRGESLLPSPKSHSSNSSGSTTTHSNNTFLHQSPPSPRPPITRYEPNNPYPTTFVQADSSSFKKVVQMLTGSTDTARVASVRNPIPPVKTAAKKEKPSSKLYERRNSLKSFKISPLGQGPHRHGTPEILSPSILDFPSLILSPVTPLIPDPFNRSPHRRGTAISDNYIDIAAEEKAIKEKGFYLHQSPANTPRDSEPRLLPLFPTTSPRAAGAVNAANCSD